ncbi:MAG: hypothetical protein IKF58_16090, partial [Bacillus sp. (in: Bacteria)]|nr:hypothetical protein [Bacillus sp. (in: firmicutes)]
IIVFSLVCFVEVLEVLDELGDEKTASFETVFLFAPMHSHRLEACESTQAPRLCERGRLKVSTTTTT